MNEEIKIQIKGIKAKIAKVVANKHSLLKENEQLKIKLDNALKENDDNVIAIQQLQQRINALQLLSGTTNEADKKELRKTIDKHIADINKTITLLNQ